MCWKWPHARWHELGGVNTSAPPPLPLFHHPGYSVTLPPGHRFPMDKYTALLPELAAIGVDVAVMAPTPAPPDWLCAVHDPAYVAAVLAARVPREIERRIGFAVTREVAQRTALVAGGTFAAGLHALRTGWAANGAGGSHHAGPDGGAGYCVTNDLAIAAHQLVAQGHARAILIVDCDVHQGDGTARIMAGRDDIITLSIHAQRNFPVRKAVSHIDIALPDGTGDDDYLAALLPQVRAALDRHRPQLMLVQAGVDPHHQDRLGRLALTDAGLARRDVALVQAARARGVAVAVTLGGGYADDPRVVARRHAAVLAAGWQAFCAAAGGGSAAPAA
jgi:acetoin utilization deacetylase AcuC-like enzyme